MYTQILVPLDGSTWAEAVLPHAQALAEKFGSTVTLLRATPPPASLTPPMPAGLPVGIYPPVGSVPPETMDDVVTIAEEERNEAASYVEKVAGSLKAGGVQVVAEATEGHAAEVILARSREIGADLIAMTTHGRSGLARLVLGSVAGDVTRMASCPVLLVRVPQEQPERVEEKQK